MGFSSFTPETVTIQVGQSVEWRNTSVITHSVTDDPRLAETAGDAWNQGWAHGASALIYILSDSLPFTDKETGAPASSHTHSFDAGAAWACLALQATRMGYHAHGMSGIQMDLARASLGVPERYRIEAACAVGRIGDPAMLDEKLRARETPSGRKPAADFVFHGNFPA